MKAYVAFIDKLPWIVKLLLALFWGIFYGIYRIAKGRILIGIIWIITGGFVIGWLIDIYHVAVYKKIKLFV